MAISKRSSIQRNIEPDEWLKEAAQRFTGLHQDAVYLEANWQALLEQYPDEWIALLDGSVVAHGHEHSVLLHSVREMGLHQAWPLIEFLDTRPVKLIVHRG